jgi:hypothetical protein
VVVVSYILNALRPLVPEGDDHSRLEISTCRRWLMLFEAFVTDQRKTADTRYVEDAHLAICVFPARHA